MSFLNLLLYLTIGAYLIDSIFVSSVYIISLIGLYVYLYYKYFHSFVKNKIRYYFRFVFATLTIPVTYMWVWVFGYILKFF